MSFNGLESAQFQGSLIASNQLAVQGLTSTVNELSCLPQALAAIPGEMGFPRSVAFRVVLEGRRRDPLSNIRNQVYRIAKEAIVNAYRHSKAKHIEAEIDYCGTGIRIAVRDDGTGIDPKALRSRRDTRWGLPGMKDTAERIGARLRILSRSGAGTEVELLVPAQIAYGTANEFSFWASVFRREPTANSGSYSLYERAQ